MANTQVSYELAVIRVPVYKPQFYNVGNSVELVKSGCKMCRFRQSARYSSLPVSQLMTSIFYFGMGLELYGHALERHSLL